MPSPKSVGCSLKIGVVARRGKQAYVHRHIYRYIQKEDIEEGEHIRVEEQVGGCHHQ